MRSCHKGGLTGPMVELARESLHTSVTDPVAASMNFLNEVASRFPAAISLAAGRPFDEFYEVTDIERYLAAYIAHLRAGGMSEARVRQAILQYGRTNGQLGMMISRMLEIDEGISVPEESVMVTSGCQEARLGGSARCRARAGRSRGPSSGDSAGA